MAQNVIYLPPGVVPGQATTPPVIPSGVPFDRQFFEKVLPPAIESFCQQVGCKVPLVELFTLDGAKHFVNGISGVSDLWVALHVAEENHTHPTQLFVPYQTIFRVEIHPEQDARREHLGFVTSARVQQLTGAAPPPPAVRAPRTPKAARRKDDK